MGQCVIFIMQSFCLFALIWRCQPWPAALPPQDRNYTEISFTRTVNPSYDRACWWMISQDWQRLILPLLGFVWQTFYVFNFENIFASSVDWLLGRISFCDDPSDVQMSACVANTELPYIVFRYTQLELYKVSARKPSRRSSQYLLPEAMEYPCSCHGSIGKELIVIYKIKIIKKSCKKGEQQWFFKNWPDEKILILKASFALNSWMWQEKPQT